MKSSIFILASFLLSLSAANAAENKCSAMFPASRYDFLLIETKRDDNKNMIYQPSPAEKYWTERAKTVKNGDQALDLVKEIMDSLSITSKEKWVQHAESALPVLLNRFEALDNVGALDMGVIHGYLQKNIERFENMSDSIYADTLNKVLEPEHKLGYWTVSYRSKINTAMARRSQNTYSLRRDLDHATSERIYNSLKVPVQDMGGGLFAKTLRSTDRSIDLNILFDSNANEFKGLLLADGDGPSRYNNGIKNTYAFQVNTKVKDQSIYLENGSGSALYYALQDVPTSHSDNGGLKTLSVQDAQGNIALEIIVHSQPHNFNHNAYEGKWSTVMQIIVPVNPTSYKGNGLAENWKKADEKADIQRANKRARAREHYSRYRGWRLISDPIYDLIYGKDAD